MVVIALYLSTTFSFNTAQQWLAVHFAFVLAWRDRVRNWRSAWAQKRAVANAEKNAAKRAAARDTAGKQAQRAEDEGFPPHAAPPLPT